MASGARMITHCINGAAVNIFMRNPESAKYQAVRPDMNKALVMYEYTLEMKDLTSVEVIMPEMGVL